jgi:hypothetical protein
MRQELLLVFLCAKWEEFFYDIINKDRSELNSHQEVLKTLASAKKPVQAFRTRLEQTRELVKEEVSSLRKCFHWFVWEEMALAPVKSLFLRNRSESSCSFDCLFSSPVCSVDVLCERRTCLLLDRSLVYLSITRGRETRGRRQSSSWDDVKHRRSQQGLTVRENKYIVYVSWRTSSFVWYLQSFLPN